MSGQPGFVYVARLVGFETAVAEEEKARVDERLSEWFAECLMKPQVRKGLK